jgi:putative FmdB family regulatory protein
MPIYEYRCSSCGHELESLQKLSDAPLVACPSCKADALVKLMSAAGFQLKGSGWYATDFKGSDKPAAKKPDAESKSGSDAKSDAPTADKAGDKAAVAEKSSDKAAAAEKSSDKVSTPAPSPAGDSAA